MPKPQAITPNASFPPTARLRHQFEFDTVFNKPKKSIDRYWVVLATPHSMDATAGHARLGLVISKKRIRLAVQRNRIKRLIRESFRHHQYALNPLDIIVLARDKTAQFDNARLRASLEKHWQRLQR